MSFNQVVTFFAVGAVGLTALLGAVIVLATARRSVAVSLAHSLRGLALGLAAAMAVVATLGSLYLSEVVGLEPCKLCWFQRIGMYPLALILVIAAIRTDGAIRLYAATLASLGGAISLYHYALQWFPSLEVTTCSATAPCSAALVWKFGFVSIPFMAFVSFATVLTLLALDRLSEANP